MRETDLGVVQDDDPLSDGCLEPSQDAIPVSVGRGDDVDVRPRERGDQQQHVERLAGKAGKTAAEQLAQAVRDAERLARRRARVRSDQFPAKLQCEERVAGGRFLYTCQFGPVQLEPEPLLEETVKGTNAERAECQSLESLAGEGALELERTAELRSQPEGREEPERLLSQAAQRDLDRPGGGGVEPLHVVERNHHGASLCHRSHHVQDGEPDGVRIEWRLAGLGEQERDFERPPTRQNERGSDLLEHIAQQLGEPGKRE